MQGSPNKLRKISNFFQYPIRYPMGDYYSTYRYVQCYWERVLSHSYRIISRFLILQLIVIGSLSGCASAPKPTLLKASITATSHLNPDAKGRASPVVVRYFELKSLAVFNGADFFSLVERDRETLGADLVAREEILLKPGETRALDRTLDPAVTHIGVVAAFRDLEHAQWRVSFVVPPQRTSQLTIRLDDRRVSINAN